MDIAREFKQANVLTMLQIDLNDFVPSFEVRRGPRAAVIAQTENRFCEGSLDHLAIFFVSLTVEYRITNFS